jgi:uncharacterized membrane protein (TIGR02234 family)
VSGRPPAGGGPAADPAAAPAAGAAGSAAPRAAGSAAPLAAGSAAAPAAGPAAPPAAGSAAGRSGRRELGAVLGLAVLGSALALWAGAPTWVRLSAARRPPLPDVAVALSGRSVEPLVPALGIVGLAAVVALLATRGRARVVVGALLAAAGLVLVLRGAGRFAAPDPAAARDLLTDAGRAAALAAGTPVSAAASGAGPLLAVLAGLALLAAGLAAAVRAGRWPGMSARYERPAAARTPARTPNAEQAAWDLLDRGGDPTD